MTKISSPSKTVSASIVPLGATSCRSKARPKPRRARDVLLGLYNRIVQGQEIDPGAVDAVIAMSAEPTLDGIIRSDVSQPPSIMIRTSKKTTVPRSTTQKLGKQSCRERGGQYGKTREVAE